MMPFTRQPKTAPVQKTADAGEKNTESHRGKHYVCNDIERIFFNLKIDIGADETEDDAA